MNNEEEFSSIHVDYDTFMLVAYILLHTIYKPANYNRYKNVGRSRTDDVFYSYLGDNLCCLAQLGLIERKILNNNKFILSDKGFKFLLWIKKNYFEEIIRVFNENISCNFENYIEHLIKKEDIALVLSLTNNPKIIKNILK